MLGYALYTNPRCRKRRDGVDGGIVEVFSAKWSRVGFGHAARPRKLRPHAPDYKMQAPGKSGRKGRRRWARASRDVEHRESSDSRYQQHHKQNSPGGLSSICPIVEAVVAINFSPASVCKCQ